MNKSLFIRIVNRLAGEVPYFQPKKDATFRNGISPLQQCTAAIRLLAYGGSPDGVDEYVRICETTARKCLEHFVVAIVDLFGTEYLRRPTPEDLRRLLFYGEQRGFPGMVGSIDCMHWRWKNCPTAWKGIYSRGHGKPTIVLEAVASQDLWIWHAFFGAPGTSNDLNVLAQSLVFNDIIYGRAPEVKYHFNGREYNLAYYLTDGIYPEWAKFVKSIPQPQIRNIHCSQNVKKVYEKTLSVHLESSNQDERDLYTLSNEEEFERTAIHNFSVEMPSNLEGLGDGHTRIEDRQAYHQLKEDFIENIWNQFGDD